MLKKMVFVFAVCLLIGTVALAGTGVKSMVKAVADRENSLSLSVVFNTQNSYSKVVGGFPWVVIDSMNNVYGPANTGVNPIAYDPYSKVVAIVHRSKSSYGGGSGNIYYNYSSDQGTTWNPRVGPMAGGLAGNTNGRYPSLTLSNGTKAKSKDSILVEIQFPLLVGGAFGGLIYSVDPGAGANSPVAVIDTGKQTWSSQFTSWASSNSNDVWFSGNSSTAGKAVTIFKSADGVSFTKANPKQFADSVFFGVDAFLGAYQGTTTYFAMTGRFKAAAPADTTTYTFGVSRSTDKGTTWSNFDVVNWHGFTGFASGKMMITDAPNQPGTNKFAVDSAGGIHWATVFIDTTVKPNKWSVYDVYKALGGSWTPIKVRDLPTHENWNYGGLGQTGIELETSVSQNGKYVCFKWLEDAQGAALKDSTPIPDVYTSVWNIAKNTWTTPQNVTASPTEVDQITHIAPIMDNDGTVYLMRNMEAQNNAGANPLKPNDVGVTAVFFGKYKLALTGVRDRFEPVVGTYTLTQNYPNPFNPSTQISFTLPVSGQTTLKVYNMLGQELTTLVSGFKQAGSYFVEFDASKMASGVYLYKLESGSFSSTKKMVLMK